jgi:hypothetical protein
VHDLPFAGPVGGMAGERFAHAAFIAETPVDAPGMRRGMLGC